MIGVAVVVGATVVAVVALGGDEVDPPAVRPADPVTAPATSDPPTTGHVSDPPTGDPDQRAADQAAAVDRVLSASVASRSKLARALQRAHGCDGNLTGATRDLRTVGDERERQLAEVATLDLSALPAGERLRGLLRQALVHSLDADRSYVRWVDSLVATSCRNGDDKAREAGDRASGLAGQSKIEFLTAWNPIAAEYGLPSRGREDI